jgi:N-acetylglucosaminyldiphosphoundecaprenol N-acetyl-beta-D-mannosaminyltransferase
MTTNVMGYNVYSNTLKDIKPERKKRLINTINAYSYVMAQSDDSFKSSLMNSHILLPDGFPIVLAAKMLNKKRIQKIAGEDVFFQLLSCLNEKGQSCFFLGASNSTLLKIQNRIAKEFPNIQVHSYSPPYKKEFSEDDINTMIAEVNKVNPDVLFLGLTAPKQEKLATVLYDKILCGEICSIGAVFDFYAGTNKRPHKIWIKLKLEWFIRLIKEPSRLWKRYLVYSPLFFFYMFRYVIHKR